MSERGCSSRSYYDNFDNYESRRSCYDNMIVSDTEDNNSDNNSEVITDDDRSVDQVCRCCGAELRGANSLNSLQNSVLYDYFPNTKLSANWDESNLDLVGPEDLPQYGKFFQKKLEERLTQVSSHIKVEKSRKEANEKRLENALKENELLRDHLRRLQTRMHTFQDRMRVGNGTSV
ncbi:uncharacterized protein LOC134821312 [Bolinopsis microptera]|uniref:uncharacterized protein LOC134821312 n=1 Tax=Bolinopsis microptera TaxID=2820187 RepID=UPI003078E200